MVDPTPVNSSAMHALLARAAQVVAAAITDRALEETECPDADLQRGGGVFVTLKLRQQLAGCIGFVEAAPPVWETVANAARAAALRDTRFTRLTPAQLADTEVEVSVLSEPEPVSPGEFVPGVHGLILQAPGGEGLLLPQVATEHDLDREAFLTALCQKAGVPGGAWRHPRCQLRAFTVQTAKGLLPKLVSEDG